MQFQWRLRLLYSIFSLYNCRPTVVFIKGLFYSFDGNTLLIITGGMNVVSPCITLYHSSLIIVRALLINDADVDSLKMMS